MKINQVISALGMLLAGILVIVVTNSYVPKEYPVPDETKAALLLEQEPETESEPEPESLESEPETTREEPETEPTKETADSDSADRLNMAYQYPEGADGANPSQSIAGQTFSRLSARDADWISGIYGFAGIPPETLASQLGKEWQAEPGTIPAWSNVNVIFYNGDGQAISGYSNAKEILSMASVYAYWKEIQDSASFQQYAEHLWAASHRYIVNMSDVYTCEGCLDGLEEETEDIDPNLVTEPAADTEIAAEAEASALKDQELMSQYKLEDIPADWQTIEGPNRSIWESVVKAYERAGLLAAEDAPAPPSCPGHVDLNISAYIDGLDEEQGLFSRDIIGNQESNMDGRWTGWNQLNQSYVKDLEQLDWYGAYGLTVTTDMYIRNPLSSAEIAAYMNWLPEDTSQERRLVIRQALQSVGCIPYYWGGKPSAAGFDGNRFGSVVSADEDGRILKGLDCSGWINWVYWSALGSRLPYESTSGLIQCGAAISREELQAGDIIVKTGDSSHVYLFLAWAEDDHMYVIHETSGSINNVTISRFNVDWPYYRRLVPN